VSTTIRVSEHTRDRLARLAEATGRPMSQLLDEAADLLERRVFFDELGARYGELRADQQTWEEMQGERRAPRGETRPAPPA
jgi:predicted transcriptional regulator